MTLFLNRTLLAIALTGGVFTSLTAHAHASLDEPVALAGTYYKAALNIGHGCDGAPVHTVTVRIPAGFKGAKPVPKAGWKLDITRAKLAQPYTSHGKTITDDVAEIRWTALNRDAWLQDAWTDSFVLRGQLPNAGGPLWFKVLQTCESSAIDWAEVPATGTSTQGLKAPAVLLDVLPSQPAGAAGHGAHAGH